MIITPDQYKKTPVYDLMCAVARGTVGLDQRVLKSVIDRGESAVEDLVRFGLDEREDDRINLDEDLISIFQYIASPKALPYLVEYLRREPDDPTEDLIHAFLRIGEAAIDPLLELHDNLGPEEAGDIAFVLAAFKKQDPRILTVLEQRIDTDAGDAVFLMGVHGDPAARPLLESLKEQAKGNAELEATLGKEIDEALASLKADSEQAQPEAVNLWDLYPDHIEPVFEVLSLEERMEFLRCSSAELRADAATSFIDRETPPEVAEVLIELASKDPNVGVRAVACEALGGVASEEPVFRLLMSKLEDRSKPIPERCGALLGVATHVREHPEIRKYIDEFYTAPGTVARALEAMWRTLDPAYASRFRKHITDEDIDVRRQAIKGVGYCQIAAEAPRLAELFKDEEFRLDALFAYALCVPVKELRRGDMLQLHRKIEELSGGLTSGESEVVETALDTRLMMSGLEPVFLPFEEDDENGLS